MADEVVYVPVTVDLDGEVLEMEIPNTVSIDEIQEKLEIIGGRPRRP